MNRNASFGVLRPATLAISIAALLGGAAPAVMAQEQEGAQEEEVIIVVGSRIRRDEFTSSAPIQIITAESATMEGLIDTGDILQGASVASGSVQLNNRFGAFVVEGGTGVRPVSLRGLGAQRSLVIINGRRAGPSGVRGQVGAFDLNVIPDSIVQRYEILKDGASSIYGSDAVAGVVNIITRTTIDGPEITFDYTMPMESGGESYSISGATGFNFDRGNIVLSGQVERRDAIRLADRDFLSCQRDLIRDVSGNLIDREDRGIGGGTPNAGCFNLYANTFIDLFTGERYIEAPDNVTTGPIDGYRPRTNGTYAGGGQAYYEDQLFFPRANQEMVQNEVTRSSVFFTTDLETGILGGAGWRNELLLTSRETQSDGWRQFFPVIGTAAIAPYPNDPTWESSFPTTIPLAVIPYPSNGVVDVDYMSWSTTLDGEFEERLSGWAWTLDAVYSHSDGQYRRNSIQASRSGDIDFADDPPAFDYLSPTILRGDYGPEFIEAIGLDHVGSTKYDQYAITGVITGDIASVPAGDVAMAVGFEYRDYEIDDTPSQASQDGDLWGESSALVTRGQDRVSEIFAEIEIPLIAGRRGFEEFTLDVSARTFDYKSYGSDNVWKAGLNWQVIPALRFRATQGTSYRAPALFELFLGNQTSFLSQTQIDPCIDWGNSSNENIRANCAAAGLPPDLTGAGSGATILSGGGAGVLKAETSDASTFGVIITPAAGNINIALDYFKIDVDDEVAQLGAGTILGGCYGAPVYPNAFCNLFTRDSGANPADPNAYDILEVNDSYINVNNQVTEGWDITVRYERDFDFGTFLLEAQGTYTLQDVVYLFDPNVASGFDTNDFNGTFGDPKFTADVRFAVQRNDWTFNWYVDFINGMDNSVFIAPTFTYFGFPDAQRVVTTPSVRYHDLSARWEGAATTVIFGISNITDEDPPFVSVDASDRFGNAPAFATQYDLLGRAAFVSVTRQF
ncbi:MAG TPA: TonB-dependent receptor [Gammaproteobacteria bacterium]|nr:TonB-dependent receptor [Gammaproteobacteria bacterium]